MEYNKKNAISLMNELGTEKNAFFFAINFDFSKANVIPISELDNEKIMFQFENFSNVSFKSSNNLSSINQNVFNPPFENYKFAFEKVMFHLNRGDSYLLNLTFPVKIEINSNLKDLFSRINAKYKLFYDDKFLVFSPETFIKIENNLIYSYPMKGTIDASIENAIDVLLNDEKELAEHYTIVDLIRNDLSMVAKKVRVNKFRFVDLLKTNKKNLYQTSSEICGELNENWKSEIGDIIEKLLPAGSISGAPKLKTCEIISEAEIDSRGFYTGVAGIFDGESLNSCVLIRFIENKDNQLIYRAGGGITTRSVCEQEFEELINKVYVPII